MERVVAKLQEWIALYGLKVIAAAAIRVIGRFAAKGICAIIRRMLQKGHKDPAPTIGVLELAKSSVNFAVRPWGKTSD